jgi:RNA polymerase sigma-70 factor (ECF subfamily)
MDQPASDENLMMMYQQGDASAFEVLYTRHKGGVYRYVLRQCDNRSVTEELFQDIWMKLIQHRDQYQVRAKFTTYLYTIARHRIIDYIRQNRVAAAGPETISLEDIETGQHGPDVLVSLQQDGRRLLAGIAGLPPEQREAVLLKEEAGMSLKEIAGLTGVSVETVKSRLRYAIKKLHQVMKV